MMLGQMVGKVSVYAACQSTNNDRCCEKHRYGFYQNPGLRIKI
jgi:hypothetical protein